MRDNWAGRVETNVFGGTVAGGSDAPVGEIGRLQSAISLVKFGLSIGIDWEIGFGDRGGSEGKLDVNSRGSGGGSICRNSHISVNETTSCCLIDNVLLPLFGR